MSQQVWKASFRSLKWSDCQTFQTCASKGVSTSCPQSIFCCSQKCLIWVSQTLFRLSGNKLETSSQLQKLRPILFLRPGTCAKIRRVWSGSLSCAPIPGLVTVLLNIVCQGTCCSICEVGKTCFFINQIWFLSVFFILNRLFLQF